MNDNKNKRIRELQNQIEELKKRFPAHSIPPALMADLDELEEDLSSLLKENPESPETE